MLSAHDRLERVLVACHSALLDDEHRVRDKRDDDVHMLQPRRVDIARVGSGRLVNAGSHRGVETRDRFRTRWTGPKPGLENSAKLDDAGLPFLARLIEHVVDLSNSNRPLVRSVPRLVSSWVSERTVARSTTVLSGVCHRKLVDARWTSASRMSVNWCTIIIGEEMGASMRDRDDESRPGTTIPCRCARRTDGTPQHRGL